MSTATLPAEISTVSTAATLSARRQPRTMRAAVLVEQRKPLVVDPVELPEELAYGQVLVEVHYSGVCGSQLGEIDGVKGEDKHLPHLLGHEGSGYVLQVGPGVKHVKPGDAVVLHWMKGNGLEAVPPQYRWRGQKLNAGWVTTFNPYAVVSENRLTALPPGFDLKRAALFGCAVTTGIGVVMNNARLKVGESIVVFGAGGVGLNVIQGAALASAWPIIAIDLFDNKLSLARRCGATHLINSNTEDPRQAVRDILGPAGADVVVDNTGMPAVIETAYELTAGGGRTVLVGVPRQGHKASLFTLPLHFGKTITGSHGGEAQPSVDIPRYVRLVEAGKLALDMLITHHFPLDEINEAIAQMRSGHVAGRCLIHLEPEKNAA